MLYCPGDSCPLHADCYRHTQPAPGRDRFAALPYDSAAGTCAWFESNEPNAALVRETAYHMWLRAGRPDGQDQAFWDQAYRSLCISSGKIRS